MYAAADSQGKAERAIRAVLAEYLDEHPDTHPDAPVRVEIGRLYGSPPGFRRGSAAQRHGVVCGKFLEASFRCFVPHSRILGTKRVVGAFGNR